MARAISGGMACNEALLADLHVFGVPGSKNGQLRKGGRARWKGMGLVGGRVRAQEYVNGIHT